MLAANERIDLAQLGQMVEVDRVGVERTGGLRVTVGVFLRRFRLVRLLLRVLGDAVGDVVDHVQARDAALVQEIDGVRLLFAEDGDQHVGYGDFLLAGRFDVQDRALYDTLERVRGLGVRIRKRRQQGGALILDVGQAALPRRHRGTD